MTLRLSKHHGLGNDFLIHLAEDGSPIFDLDTSALAMRFCDRRTGIGADGLIIGTVAGGAARAAGEPDLEMTLLNADGSPAEMSGNGLRCLAHAEARRRKEPEGEIVVRTVAGFRTVNYGSASRLDTDGAPRIISGRADMGPAGAGPSPDRDAVLPTDAGGARTAARLALDATHSRTLDLGNPHLVLRVVDPTAVAIEEAGPIQEARYDDGMNVHVIAPTPGESDAIDIVIWERGAGVTAACGTGATAAARAAHDWGLVGTDVLVHMPGGDVRVEVGDTMHLTGTAVHIADIEVRI